MVKTALLGEGLDVDLLFSGGDVPAEKRLLEKRPDHFKPTGLNVFEDVTSFEQQSGAEMIARGIEIGQRPDSGVEEAFGEDAGATATHTTDHDEII